MVCALAVAGCTTWVGTTAKSFLGHVRNDPDPNVRYVAYSKLATPDAYDSEEEKDEAVRILIDKFEKGHEPMATRAMICRTLGQLRDPQAHDLLVKAVNSSEAVIKIESCRALGKVGRPDDATILAQVMTLDNLEDARIAAIEGLAELKTKDPRIFQLLVDEHGPRRPGHPPGLAQCPPQADRQGSTAPIPPTGGASSSRCSSAAGERARPLPSTG